VAGKTGRGTPSDGLGERPFSHQNQCDTIVVPSILTRSRYYWNCVSTLMLTNVLLLECLKKIEN
jgi:hypothetical protein